MFRQMSGHFLGVVNIGQTSPNQRAQALLFPNSRKQPWAKVRRGEILPASPASVRHRHLGPAERSVRACGPTLTRARARMRPTLAGKGSAPQFDLATALTRKEYATVASTSRHCLASVELLVRPVPLLVLNLFPCVPRRKRTVRKSEGMVQYHLARCPLRGVFESPEYARAEELKQKVKDIEAKAKKRWENNLY